MQDGDKVVAPRVPSARLSEDGRELDARTFSFRTLRRSVKEAYRIGSIRYLSSLVGLPVSKKGPFCDLLIRGW
jgi:hypothetical protein